MDRAHRPYFWLAGVLITAEVAVWLLGGAAGSEASARLWLVGRLGFWPGLLGDWQSNFRLQPITMFATYWLIHAGPIHLAGNIALIGWFARQIGPALRPSETVEIWVGSVLGGGIAFGALSHSFSPMIGASGGAFGLLGAYVAIDHVDSLRTRGVRYARIRTGIICIVILTLSLVDFTLRDAVLAWQAHLGGFVTGLVLTLATGAASRQSP